MLYMPKEMRINVRTTPQMDKILRRENDARFFTNMHSEWAKDVCRMAALPAELHPQT